MAKWRVWSGQGKIMGRQNDKWALLRNDFAFPRAGAPAKPRTGVTEFWGQETNFLPVKGVLLDRDDGFMLAP